MRSKDQVLLENLYEKIYKEEYWDSRKPVEGYVDSNELIGQRLWVHTNRTHRNQGYNGMIGIYRVNSKGHRTGSPLQYTNEIRLKGSIVFEASETSSETIVKSGKRTLVAGVSGIVEKTEGDTNGMEEVNFQPEVKWFYRVSDPEKTKITTADEIYFSADESGKYIMFAKNPR